MTWCVFQYHIAAACIWSQIKVKLKHSEGIVQPLTLFRCPPSGYVAMGCTDDGVKLKFLENSGPKALLGTLSRHHGVPSLIQRASDVVAASSSRFELNKEAFMDADAHLKLIELGSKHLNHPGAIQGAASALHTLASADDPRVIASKV